MPGPAGRAQSAEGSVSGRPSGISDDELVAFVRWQREYTEALNKQRAAIDALTPDPGKPFDEAVKEVGRATVEQTERFRPVITELHRRAPLGWDRRYQLATEAVGGLFHWEYAPAGGAQLIFARDEERIGAARRKFGADAVDDILAREALILAEMQRP
jgi:hypothetical protein